jgi:hypothetical protein
VTNPTVKEIRVYVEGGGDRKSGKDEIRRGFHQFLSQIIGLPGGKQIRWNFTACGNGKSTQKAFTTALKLHPAALNILIVDSDGPVEKSPSRHLFQQDQIDSLAILDDQCHLMVQVMET